MKRNKFAYRLALAVKEIIFIVFSISALLPIYFMIVTAFKSRDQYSANPFALPKSFILDNFTKAFEAGYLQWLVNTLFIGVISVVMVTVLASLSAYAFAWLYKKPPKVIIIIIAVLMMVPPIVMLIPLFKMASWADMVNTYTGVIVIYSGLMMPFSMYMLISFFGTVPRASIEAALIDGASPFVIFRTIVLPLSVSTLLTLGVVNLLWVWNELLIALTFLQNDYKRTLMGGLSMFQSKNNLDVPLTMAGLFIATVPIVVAYLFSQKYFVRGLMMGADR